jgi:HlyD family secretion protein
MSLGKKVPIILIAVILVAVAVWWTSLRRQPEPAAAVLSGNIELTEVNIAFKTPGRLIALDVREGDAVKAGQVIGRLDTQQLESQRAMANAQVWAAQTRITQLRTAIAYQEQNLAGLTAQREAEVRAVEAQLDELREGAREQEKQQARALLRQAESQFQQAEADWKRAERLFANDDISVAEHDRAKALYLAAQARRDEARERLDLVEAGPRAQTIAAAQANVERARAALNTTRAGQLELERLREELQTRLAEVEHAEASLAVIETQIQDAVAVSPINGVVLSKAAEAGEVLAAGVTIVTIGDLQSPWLRGYISQSQQGRVRLGSEVKVRVDSYPDRVFTGRLSFLASEAEFTPKQIQTAEERAKLVYRVKVDIPNPDGILKANMPADAEVPLLPAQD